MKNENRTCSACGRVFHIDHYFCWAFHQAVCKYDSEKAIKNGGHKEWLEKRQKVNELHGRQCSKE